MKRTLLLLVFYLSLTVTVGKHVRAICCQLFTEKSYCVKTLLLDLTDAEENEETDSEDTEDRSFEDNTDEEIASLHVYSPSTQVSTSDLQAINLFNNHDKEIGTPPPRF